MKCIPINIFTIKLLIVCAYIHFEYFLFLLIYISAYTRGISIMRGSVLGDFLPFHIDKHFLLNID